MYQVATTSVSVLRGTTTNAFGDVLDTGAVHQSGIPAYLNETTAVIYDQVAQTPRVVRTTTCILPFGTDVLETDQVKDEQTATIYMVEAVTTPHIPGRAYDLNLVLKNVS